MKIDDIFNDLRLAISLSKDTVLLDDIYVWLSNFIDCFMFYVCTPAVDKIKYKDRLIFQKFLIISVFRFKRGLVFLPDET